MRRLLVPFLALALVGSVATPARADHEAGLLLGILVLPYAWMGGALVAALPFWVLSAAKSDTLSLSPRPSGSGRIESVWPDEEARALLVHFDFGGYPPKGSRLGWEARADLLTFQTRPEDLFIRWDGLALLRSSPLNTGFNTEVLAGVTVWPAVDVNWSTDWNGGFLAGVRWSYSTGGLRLLRFEAESLLIGFSGARAHGLDGQVELRAGFSLHWPGFMREVPASEATTGLGLTYRGMLPLGEADVVPEAHFLLLSAFL